MNHFSFWLLFFIPVFLQGQPGPELGANLGAAYYFGDLNTDMNLSQPGLTAHVYGRYNFDERISLKLGFYYGRIQANDSHSPNAFERRRNLSFQSNVWDGTLQLEFNFFPYWHGSKREFFTPYLFAGLTIYHFNPLAELEGQNYRLRELGTEGQSIGDEYSLTNLGIAYGGGLKWDLNYYWSMNLEWSGRWLFTDYLDDVSTVYPDADALFSRRGELATQLSDRSDPNHPSGQIGRTGIQRGNSKNSDSYHFITIGLAYYFGRVMCPDISRPRPR